MKLWSAAPGAIARVALLCALAGLVLAVAMGLDASLPPIWRITSAALCLAVSVALFALSSWLYQRRFGPSEPDEEPSADPPIVKFPR